MRLNDRIALPVRKQLSGMLERLDAETSIV
jgi:hypothetical protein